MSANNPFDDGHTPQALVPPLPAASVNPVASGAPDLISDTTGLISGQETAAPAQNPGQPQAQDTLNEPVWQTIWRDFRRIAIKMSFVFLPRKSRVASELHDWDLWGPLVATLTLAVILSLTAPPSQSELLFTAIFVISWLGGSVLTFNSLLLGGKISFFQSVSLFGYCLFPLTFCAFLVAILKLVLGGDSSLFLVLKIIFVVVTLGWSTFACVPFLSDLVPTGRKTLALYPVFLFFCCMAWMVLMVK
ncbi:hypothetical protein PAPYR_2789 [Paratrimastix pyriformis]|uniref:Protein YIPF n=1 Tax=Paratrimastix pyriformis TaxID=342808 RepID=A0ABQ8UQ34_9EUKA|nr:hypothetical protein PAPYR_2789 [Paratrimastix pyriformis]|eukprot:GAFH01004121.1.p1 GENE.GAFH01004121.1~~GAFH01004121.1.p1  ORF type:complete len:247 (-),score=22.07 GAFH01004121.1:74-814(-)